VIFNETRKGDDLVATGLEFLHGKDYSTKGLVYAKKEVILSAGTIISPQILELSGIGSHRLLQSLEIESKIDLPGVGENVQEHQRVSMFI